MLWTAEEIHHFEDCARKCQTAGRTMLLRAPIELNEWVDACHMPANFIEVSKYF